MTIKKKPKVELPEVITVPALAVRDMAIFPHMMAPLFMGREKSIKAVEAAMETPDSYVLLLTQKDPKTEDPRKQDLFPVGTLAKVAQLLRLPDGTIKALVEGRGRYAVTSLRTQDGMLKAVCSRIDTVKGSDAEIKPYRDLLIDSWKKYSGDDKVAAEMRLVVEEEQDPERVLELICAQVPFSTTDKMAVMAEANLVEAMNLVIGLLETELEIKTIKSRIEGRVKRQMEKNQRTYYLNEQIKAIRKELGDAGEDGPDDVSELEEKVNQAQMPKEADEQARQELRRLRQMPPMSSEAVVVRTYIETLLELPWTKKSRVSKNLETAARILDEDHSGLEKVKERVLEYLAVQKRVGKVKSPILCFVGAPGVGKTSLGESIARATGRQYVRVALGGVHDESEIRGHRRTYVGSMPGQIIKSMIRAGVKNPLFLLDEIDKMGADYRGDPAAALLEALDPEQNDAFRDHYLEIPYDLSDVMFVATSNSYNIPPALLDRMEVISLSGYTEEEKVHIAEHHLIPKQLKATGLQATEVDMTREAVIDIVRYWTREAGVRSLERAIEKVFRKIVFALAKKPSKTTARITPEVLPDYLGPAKFTIGLAQQEPVVGSVNGLAWTEVGGDLLQIEAQIFPGKGHVQRTGSLGDVMKESVETARSVVRSRARELGIADEKFYSTDLHVHFPEGATPKDGPSAGAATTTAIISAMSGIPVRPDVAMTGEITLHGAVLEIGGLKEKLLAAARASCTKVLIPERNMRDLEEVPASAKTALKIVPVKTIDDVLREALVRLPEPLTTVEASPTEKTGA